MITVANFCRPEYYVIESGAMKNTAGKGCIKMWTVISYIAAALTTIAFVPQLLKVIKTKNTSDLSLLMYAGFFIGVVCWFAYGIARMDFAIIIANGITAIAAFVILLYKIRNVIKGEKI